MEAQVAEEVQDGVLTVVDMIDDEFRNAGAMVMGKGEQGTDEDGPVGDGLGVEGAGVLAHLDGFETGVLQVQEIVREVAFQLAVVAGVESGDESLLVFDGVDGQCGLPWGFGDVDFRGDFAEVVFDPVRGVQ